jgi:hypothetical protein
MSEIHGRPDVVRPFVMSGGRTRVDHPTLRIESIVETDAARGTGGVGFEQAEILRLCTQPQSVAEVAAHLTIPVGVALVLVADLVADDRLVLHHSDPVEIELDALTRMIDRVRSL